MATSTVRPVIAPSRFELARHQDDSELCRLLRDNPMDGDIRVSLERQPSCFAAATIEGSHHDFIVARSASGNQLQASGSRSVYDAFVNGKPKTLGYLGQLRVDHGSNGVLGLIRGGYRFLRQLDERDAIEQPGRARFHVTTIVADNLRARRLLEKGLPGLPTYQELAALMTLVLHANKNQRKTRWNGTIERGPEAFEHYRDEIGDCLRRNAQRFQFARQWHTSELCSASTPGLGPQDFCIAVRQGRVVGCLAVWDQRAFKQIVIRGYRRRIAWARPFFNLLAPSLRVPRLPRVGATLDMAYASHIAVDGDDVDCFLNLVNAALRYAANQSIELLTLGLAQAHPLLDAVRGTFPHRPYTSVLYTVHWENGAAQVSQLDGRVPHMEVATL